MKNIFYRYIGVVGLQLIFCWFYTFFANPDLMSIPGVLGSFIAIFFVSIPLPIVLFFLNLIIGKNINHLLIFYVFLICSLAASFLVLLGELGT